MVNAYEMKNGNCLYLNEELPLQVNPASGYDETNPYVGRDPRFDASILHDGSMWAGRETETWHGGLDSRKVASVRGMLPGVVMHLKSLWLNRFLLQVLPLSRENPWIYFPVGRVLSELC